MTGTVNTAEGGLYTPSWCCTSMKMVNKSNLGGEKTKKKQLFQPQVVDNLKRSPICKNMSYSDVLKKIPCKIVRNKFGSNKLV